MPAFFRQAEGSRTTTRTINAANSGNNLIVVNVALTTPTIGDIVEGFSSASGNNCFWTLVNTSGTLGYYVRPKPVHQLTANGSIARLNRANVVPISATAISGVTPLSGTDNLAAIWVPGALFITNGVWRNDRAIVSGTTTSGNMGGWPIAEVLSEDMIVVRPPDRGVGMSAATDGILTVRQGFVHVATSGIVSDEVLGWGPTFSLSGNLPLPGPNGDYQGAGNLRDYIRARPFQQDEAARTLVLIEGVAGIVLSGISGLSGLTWPHLDHIVISHRTALSGNTTGNLTHFTLTQPGAATAPLTPIRMDFGQNTFGDRFTCEQPSVAIGLNWTSLDANAAFWVNSFFGSYVDRTTPINVFRLSSGTSGVGSIFRAGFQPRTGAMAESCVGIGDGGAGYSPLGIADAKNILLAKGTQNPNVSNAGTILEGLILASGFTALITTTFSSGDPMMILDPRVDFDISVYCANLLTGTTEKRFTFNPALVSSDDTPDTTPISGGYVEIFEVNTATKAETQVFSGFTDIGGRINGGSGYRMRRQFLDADEVLTNFSHRMTFQGGGFRLHRFDLFALSGAFNQNITITRVAPDYEGEFDE